VLVQVAETLGARSQLATEFVTDLILPQFVILPIAVLLVWLALSRGIRPLAELQGRIRRRESQDLSPIPEGDVPVEVAPLVHAINDLLDRLDRSLAAQRHFLADAAHQLKTPLAGLRTQAELAAREIDSGRGDPAAMRHSLRQIALASQRAAHMVNQLLAMARAEDQGQLMRRQPLDLAAVVRAVVRDAVPKALERGIDLGWEGPDEAAADAATGPGAPRGRAMAIGEPVLLGEMVRNLVDNALQYVPRGGTVTARVRPSGGIWLVQVEDNGPGIAPEERGRIFQPFYRPLGNPVDGSGLGLAIVKEVAERHGGSVVVDDAFPHAGAGQRGALFTVRIPALPAEPAPPPADAG
jgi:two-component system, OmpR family, sensor histidine kinase TctE